jgi:hypothetical protein
MDDVTCFVVGLYSMNNSKANFYVYRNLHTNTFSVVYKQKVIQHPKELLCYGCSFVVSEKGRQRVLLTKRKNVHAKVKCRQYTATLGSNCSSLKQITYNPYTHEYFMMEGRQIFEAKIVSLKDNKIYLVE